MTEQLTADHFTPYVGNAFEVRGTQHRLTLKSIDRPASGKAPPESGFREPFTLVFSGARSPVLPEGLNTLEVDGAPALELYIMPIHTPAPDRQDYQVMFN